MPLIAFADAYARDYRPNKGGAWCYEDACLYRGLVLLHAATGEGRWLDHLIRLAGAQVAADGALAGYDPGEFNIDNILGGRSLLYLADQTGEARFRAAARRLADQLAHHPRTATGNYWHKAIYPQQVWLDGLYMALPFQIDYARRTGQPDLVADAVCQFGTALDLTRRPDGLYAHGHDGARVQAWADRATGQSQTLWSRALGWLAMALADSRALLGPASPAWLDGVLTDLLDRLAALTEPGGLWLQVTDRPDLPGNYPETSASAMIAHAALSAARQGLWPPGATLGSRVIDTLGTTRLAATRKDPRVRLTAICAVAGLGGADPRRDGSPGYYLSEPVVADDPKGVGPLLMAVAGTLAPGPTAIAALS
jgi:unsaturated rhamnogalacturonyl hydrolase